MVTRGNIARRGRGKVVYVSQRPYSQLHRRRDRFSISGEDLASHQPRPRRVLSQRALKYAHARD